ncbi:MAG: hypothetical protein ACRDH5_14240 [bacterium]
MHLVVRTYEHTDPRYEEEGFRRVRDELVRILSGIDGFVEYYSAYDRERRTVTSVSIYETKEAAEESNRVAVEWGEKNLAIMGTAHPTTWAGEILVGAEGLPTT